MTAKQMKDLLRNMSKEKNINAQILQRNYMMERLLERISLSPYKDNFILKGGMLVASLVGIDTRSTMDLDATIKGLLVSEKTMSDIFNNLVQMDIMETVLAEKMETILSKTVFNTRMRDFYDLYILSKLRKNSIDMQILTEAILKTAEKRNTIIIYAKISQDLNAIFYSEEMFKLWQNYQI